MKKIPYIDLGIEIVLEEEDNGDVIKFFSNELEKRIKAFVYICDNARYPKRIAVKIGEFNSLGNAYLNCSKYVFEKGRWFVYLNFKGNFYIYKEDLLWDPSKRCRS